MKLIAKTPCSFGGMKFYIGDEIPGEYVLNPEEKEKMGVLVCVADEPGEEASDGGRPETGPVEIVIHAEEGDMPLSVTPAGLQSVFDVLTGKPAEASAIIEEMTDGDALILLHISDNRKAVKAAAEARAKAISEDFQESAGEQ